MSTDLRFRTSSTSCAAAIRGMLACFATNIWRSLRMTSRKLRSSAARLMTRSRTDRLPRVPIARSGVWPVARTEISFEANSNLLSRENRRANRTKSRFVWQVRQNTTPESNAEFSRHLAHTGQNWRESEMRRSIENHFQNKSWNGQNTNSGMIGGVYQGKSSFVYTTVRFCTNVSIDTHTNDDRMCAV